jgi:nicotinate-nucleotide adenylyltransferase
MDTLELLRSRLGEKPARLGVMGGGFDPVHIGHLAAAEQALEQFRLDCVVFVPTGTPPHKRGFVTPAELRYLMVAVATAGHPRFWVSRCEIDNPATDYTVETMGHLRRLLGSAAELFFITGADAVLEIMTWREPERLLSLCSVIAATRPGYDLTHLDRLQKQLAGGERIVPMNIPGLAVSSTVLRQRVADGHTIRYLVPREVEDLIVKWGLYAPRG